MATLAVNNNSKYNAFYRPQQTLFTPQEPLYEDDYELDATDYQDERGEVYAHKEMWFELDVSGMGIRTLSREIRVYPHLTALYMNNNKIVELPDDIFSELRSLVVIDVSFNLLSRLPSSIGSLDHLEKLAIHHNRITELPLEMGQLFKLREIYLEGNPILSPPGNILQGGAEMITSYLRERIPPAGPPPERRFISYLEPNITIAEKDRFRVLTYNVLAEPYAAPDRYFYCPPWALDWDYRKHGILKEILSHDCDIICLQEVEAGQFVGFFQPEMAKAGYSGVISTKSRARTMEDWSTVDGCAIFYKRSKFALAEEHNIEYQSIAMSRHKEFVEDPEAFSRLITKDNVAIAIVLQLKDQNGTSPFNSPTKAGAKNWTTVKKKHILVANTHIHWNPEHRDVKLVQVQLLLEELGALVSPNSKWYNTPMILAGDFNSTPDSGPYELLTTGRLPPNHPELEPFTYGRYTHLGMEHRLQISSSYAPIGEPQFTNYTNDYEGVLDYIWYSRESLGVSKVLQPVDEEVVRATRLPNPYMHSDHIYLLSEFYLKNN